jgi:predicted site-specific integrase-resolvase
MKMKITEASKAFRINYRTLKRWVNEGKVRSERRGVYVLVEVEDVIEQIKQSYDIIKAITGRMTQLDRWERERQKEEGGEK